MICSSCPRCDSRSVVVIRTTRCRAPAVDVTVPELKLEAFLPVDEATAAVLGRPAG